MRPSHVDEDGLDRGQLVAVQIRLRVEWAIFLTLAKVGILPVLILLSYYDISRCVMRMIIFPNEAQLLQLGAQAPTPSPRASEGDDPLGGVQPDLHGRPRVLLQVI